MARGSLSLFERFFSSKKKEPVSKEPVADNLVAREASHALPPAVHQDSGRQRSAAPSASRQATAIAPATGVVATGIAVAEPTVGSTVDAGGLSTVAAAVASQDGMTGQSTTASLREAAEATPMDAEQRDTELEYNSMVLLSKLEQLVIRLSDNTIQKSMPLVIDALVELTNHLAEFSDQLPVAATQKVSLAALIARDVENYAQLRSQHVQENRLVLGASATGFGQEPNAFHQLSNDILRVVNIYLSANVKAFYTPRISEQWKTLYTGFFVNLSKTIRSVQDIQQGQQGGGKHHG